MAGKHAKTLTKQQLAAALRRAAHSRYPDRDRVMVLLSVKAGLRAGEIAKLTWPMVVDAQGRIASHIELHDAAAKKRSGRTIPLHPDLRRSLRRLHKQNAVRGPVIRSERGEALRPSSVVNWFARLYRELGFEGCTSHLGRRTFSGNLLSTSSPVIRCALSLLRKQMPSPLSPCQKGGRVLGARCSTARSPGQGSNRPRRGTAPSHRRSSAGLGRINAGAALHAGLGWARKPKPGLILREQRSTECQPRPTVAISPPSLAARAVFGHYGYASDLEEIRCLLQQLICQEWRKKQPRAEASARGLGRAVSRGGSCEV